MKGKISDEARLGHILESISEIEKAINGHTFESFVDHHVVRIAVVKWLEIIGEAANHISDETKNENNEIEWRKMKGLRNAAVHEYFGINYEVIWNAATLFLEDLKIKIERINNK
jgi:uncharacterized protein with HEPN domain